MHIVYPPSHTLKVGKAYFLPHASTMISLSPVNSLLEMDDLEWSLNKDLMRKVSLENSSRHY